MTATNRRKNEKKKIVKKKRYFLTVNKNGLKWKSGIGWLVGGSFMSETFLAINVTV